MNNGYSLEEGRSIGRFMGADVREVGDWRNGEVALVAEAHLGPHLRDPQGRVRPGVILTMVDNVAGFCGGLASLPDGWVVTTNLALRTATPVLDPAGPIEITSRLLRRGRSAVVTDAVVRDHGRNGAVVAEAVVTSAILVPSGGVPEWERPAHLGLAFDPAGLPEYYEWLGVEALDEHTVQLEVRDVLRNPWGILHGGVIAALIDAAGVNAVPGSGTADAMVHFLAPGRVGPVRAQASVLATRDDGTVVRVEVRDHGADDRLMALAVTTLRA